MTGIFEMRRIALRRSTLIFLACGIAFAIVYLVFLAYQDRRAAAYLEGLRHTDPDGYLEQIRMLDGFSRYAIEFGKLKKFDQFRPAAPAFMVGRWTLRDKPERIPVGTSPNCSDPITFEYGRMEVTRDGISLPSEFRLAGQLLEVRPRQGDPITVKLVSFGAAIDHLELIPPERDHLFYAYPCGM
ncbi:MAG: hypothetical protein WCD16_13745 [Paracoccaceae bacterium]|jgi:hypothetical protein